MTENNENGYTLETAIRNARRFPEGDSIKLQTQEQAILFVDWLAENGYLGTIEHDGVSAGWIRPDPG